MATYRLTRDGCIVDPEGGVLYDEECGLTRDEKRAVVWLLNHGHADASFEELEPLMDRRVAQQRASARALKEHDSSTIHRANGGGALLIDGTLPRH